MLIYLDASVLLAGVLVEDVAPDPSLWENDLVSSRLLVYEVHVRLLREAGSAEHLAGARNLLSRVQLVEMAPLALARMLEPFPVPVRTLDALHLATMDFLVRQGSALRLATYDDRLGRAAKAMGIRLARL